MGCCKSLVLISRVLKELVLMVVARDFMIEQLLLSDFSEDLAMQFLPILLQFSGF